LLATTTARSDLGLPSGPTRLEIRRLRPPVLAVYGEWSPCLPSLRGLQRLVPGCRTVIARRAGHFHPVTRPEVFVTALRGFLDGADWTDRRGIRGRRMTVPRRSPALGPGRRDHDIDRGRDRWK